MICMKDIYSSLYEIRVWDQVAHVHRNEPELMGAACKKRPFIRNLPGLGFQKKRKSEFEVEWNNCCTMNISHHGQLPQKVGVCLRCM